MKITFISDTHTKHRFCEHALPGGEILIHSGDIMNSGWSKREVIEFLDWFSEQPYEHKIFIAGNHDRIFEIDREWVWDLIEKSYKHKVTYLEDEWIEINGVKIYGTPWQPEFYNWAFNLPRRGEELLEKWQAIPDDTDILISHGPAMGYLDASGPPYNEPNLGCELLRERIDLIKPKIHVFGHIHGSAGYLFNGSTHFFNASILNERYEYMNTPMTIIWNTEGNEVEFLD